MTFTSRYPGHEPPAFYAEIFNRPMSGIDVPGIVREFATTPLAPPPEDPKPKKPRAIQVEYPPTPRAVAKAKASQPPVKREHGRSEYMPVPRVAIKVNASPQIRKHKLGDPETCLHQAWIRNGIRGGGLVKIRCRECPTHRTVTEEMASVICSPRVVVLVIPAARSTRKLKPEEHGTHRQYKNGCRCELCKQKHNASGRSSYQTRTGSKGRQEGMRPSYREVMELQASGLPVRQIAEKVGKTKWTVKTYLRKARRFERKMAVVNA